MIVYPKAPVTAWSYSTLKQFEKCPHSIELAKVHKQPGPVLPADNPMVRGNRVHKNGEDFVQGVTEKLGPELKKHFETDIAELREDYAEGNILVEEDWGFTKEWASTGWMSKDVWARIKCDVVKTMDVNARKIIDYKTGKSFGNEVSHIQQGQLYSIAAFMKYPEIEFVEASFWYVDEGKKSRPKIYTRKQMIPIINSFTKRANKMTDCVVFIAKPNRSNCKYCDFGPNNGGTNVCEFGVDA